MIKNKTKNNIYHGNTKHKKDEVALAISDNVYSGKEILPEMKIITMINVLVN